METERIITALIEALDVALFLSKELYEKTKPNTRAEMIARWIKNCLNEAATATEAAVDDMSRQSIEFDFKLKMPDMYGKNMHD